MIQDSNCYLEKMSVVYGVGCYMTVCTKIIQLPLRYLRFLLLLLLSFCMYVYTNLLQLFIKLNLIKLEIYVHNLVHHSENYVKNKKPFKNQTIKWNVFEWFTTKSYKVFNSLFFKVPKYGIMY